MTEKGSMLCKHESCSNQKVRGGLQGLCRRHGGGKRCFCGASAAPPGIHCKAHGGGHRCSVEGCASSACYPSYTRCIRHGGGRRCSTEGCSKIATHASATLCKAHALAKQDRVEPCLPPMGGNSSPPLRNDGTRTQNAGIQVLRAPSPPLIMRDLVSHQSARFAKIKTGSAPKVVGSKSGNAGRGSAKKGVSVNNSKQAKLEAVKRAGKNKKADLLKSKRVGIKPKSLKEAAKKKAKVVAGKASQTPLRNDGTRTQNAGIQVLRAPSPPLIMSDLVSDQTPLRGGNSADVDEKLGVEKLSTLTLTPWQHLFIATSCEIEDYFSDMVPDVVPDVVPDMVPEMVPDVVPDVVPDMVPDMFPSSFPTSSLHSEIIFLPVKGISTSATTPRRSGVADSPFTSFIKANA